MKVAEFRNLLIELAYLYEDAGDNAMREALLKFAELFDERQNLDVVEFMKQIRRVRHLDAA